LLTAEGDNANTLVRTNQVAKSVDIEIIVRGSDIYGHLIILSASNSGERPR